MFHTNGIESALSILKWACKGTYRMFYKKHMQRYVNELSSRWNTRPFDTIEQTGLLASVMVGKRLRWKDSTARS